jgi:hypothetical protein
LILSRVGVTYKTGLDWMIGFINALYIHNSGLQEIQHYRYSTYFPGHSCTRTRILSPHKSYPCNEFIRLSFQITHEVFLAHSNPFSSQSSSNVISRTRPNSLDYCSILPKSLSLSYPTTDCQSVSLSWNKAPIWVLLTYLWS